MIKPYHPEILRSRLHTHVRNAELHEKGLVSDKMVAIGVLSAGLAHEVRNPIHAARNILGGLERIMPRLGGLASEDPDQLREAAAFFAARKDLLLESFRDAGNAVARIQQLVETIGVHTTGTRIAEEADIAALAAEIVADLEPKRAARKARLGLEADGPVRAPIFAFLRHAIANVVENALDAVPEGTGAVRVTVVDAGEEVVIEVGDNGPGIPPERQPYVFDAFVTTKRTGRGAGLGLYIARNIVEHHHRGTIECRSNPDTGTLLTLRLPKHPELVPRKEMDFKGAPVPI